MLSTLELPLSPERAEAATVSAKSLRSACDDDIRQIARLLRPPEPDDKLLGTPLPS